MKLRNKNTGEIITLKDEGELALLKLVKDSLPNGLRVWEEVKEPLIKDEKIRNIVLAWAETLKGAMIDGIITFYVDKAYQTFQVDVLWEEAGIKDIAELDLNFDHDGLTDGERYTIAELCGEGEE